MTQTWKDLLFMHYSFSPESIRTLVPKTLELDTFEGAAWIGVVPFKMRDVRPRYSTNWPYFSNFLELNVRTYVTVNGVPGVYFFSLDASNLFAVEGARSWFRLPYYLADMKAVERDDRFRYRSIREDKRGNAAGLDLRYRPKGEVFHSSKGSLEHFLTERYCLFTTYGDDVIRADIHHAPWPLQKADAEVISNTMLASIGLSSNDVPHLLFSRSILTVEWAPRMVTV